jgi:hypothetical protein
MFKALTSIMKLCPDLTESGALNVTLASAPGAVVTLLSSHPTKQARKTAGRPSL